MNCIGKSLFFHLINKPIFTPTTTDDSNFFGYTYCKIINNSSKLHDFHNKITKKLIKTTISLIMLITKFLIYSWWWEQVDFNKHQNVDIKIIKTYMLE